MADELINVTKTFLPPFDEYATILRRAWDKGWVTNNGELVQELEAKLCDYLGVKHLIFCSSGTIALQIAIKALGITGDVITTPFSYVATTGAILWENCNPVFADINEKNFCIDSGMIEAAITESTSAILATHVYGHPCNIDAIETIADRYNLKVIYDGAHAFGSKYKGLPVLSFGDVSTCSFHATKLFHTVEGGCMITNNDQVATRLRLHHQFGHVADTHYTIGINGKNSEFHAAMGLSNMPYLDSILGSRKVQWNIYKEMLEVSQLQLLEQDPNVEINFSYFPVVFRSEELVLEAIRALREINIVPRRYFYPSLNNISYIKYKPAPVSESIAERVICLPLSLELTREVQMEVARTVLKFQ